MILISKVMIQKTNGSATDIINVNYMEGLILKVGPSYQSLTLIILPYYSGGDVRSLKCPIKRRSHARTTWIDGDHQDICEIYIHICIHVCICVNIYNIII